MRIITSLSEMMEMARGWLAGGTVALVPVIGELHQGHQSMLLAARNTCEVSVVCLYHEGLAGLPDPDQSYDQMRDVQALEDLGVDAVFLPSYQDLFPLNFATYITPGALLLDRWGGERREKELRDFATLMTKLFHLVRPDVVYIEQKDAQQIALLRQLIRDLNIDVRLCIMPTMREFDGLAVSSQNDYLSLQERLAAPIVYRALLLGKMLIERGERDALTIERAMAELVATEAWARLEYVAICDQDTFARLRVVVPGIVLLLAVQIGEVHLLDSLVWEGYVK